MSCAPIDIVGSPGVPTTQGLGRLIGQYAKSTKLIALLRGVYEMGQDLDLLFQKISRMLDLSDDATQDSPNTAGAKGMQLRGIGGLVGVTNVVPGRTGPIPLTDAQYRPLIAARIYRNFVRGGTTPQIIHAIQLVMPDLTTGDLLRIIEVGHMTTLIIVGRPVADWEAGIFAIPGGISMTKGALLPRPHGVAFATYWQGTGCFCFGSSRAGSPYAPIMTGGHGWNTFNPANPTNNRTSTETGQWAGTF